MLFIVIIAALILMLAVFSSFTAKQNRQSWRSFAIIAAISGSIMIVGIIKLPYWSYNQSAKAAPTTKVKTAGTIQSTKTMKTVFNEDEQRKQAAKNELKVTHALQQIRTNYQDLGKVTADRSAQTFTIKPTNAKYMQALEKMQQNPSQNQANIEKVTTSYQALSRSIKKNVFSGYTVQLLQPHSDKVLLAVKDGQIVVNHLKA